MRNYILGVLSGLAGAALYTLAPALAWYYWLMFVGGCFLIAFSFDVIFGSLQEHQQRAAWMGGLLFGGPGVVLQALVWGLGV
ncbi:MAG: hypothetical protein HOB38_11335 [Deltaproteobacteria bacterium]|nr:hypothetical protein [Deltaproteobacteria bacterium]MBT6612688.1 hypothetical protein [Deltaproteobacteria bacterium]